MIHRLASLAIAATLVASANAQTVRFQTTVGTFDMILNPTNNDDLQPLVDNMLANVAAGIYDENIVNRAPEGFVLQLGSFRIDPAEIANVSTGVFESNEGFDPVIVDTDGDLNPDIDLNGLSNVRGTVSLALSGGNPNTGSASFFVNLGNNAGLDAQGFIPFAAIVDMTDVDRLVSLDQANLAPGQNNPNFNDIPLDAEGNLVIVESASVITESNFSFVGPLRSALGVDEAAAAAASVPVAPSIDELAASLAPPSSAPLAADPTFATAASPATAIPEPSSWMLALLALGVGRRCRR